MSVALFLWVCQISSGVVEDGGRRSADGAVCVSEVRDGDRERTLDGGGIGSQSLLTGCGYV